MLAAAIIAVVGVSGGPALAADPKSELMLAQVASPELELSHFGHMFDAARVRFSTVFSPNKASPARPAESKPAALPRTAPPRRANRSPAPPTVEKLLAHPEATDRYDELIMKYSDAYHLDPRLLKSVIAAESEFCYGAVSNKGAHGLMQVMPDTAREMGVPAELLHEPEYNIKAGAAYLARLFSAAWRRYRLKGVRYQDAPLWLTRRIIAAYNAGPRVLFSFKRHWVRETRHYVKKVLLYYRSRITDFRRAPKALKNYQGLKASLSSGTPY